MPHSAGAGVTVVIPAYRAAGTIARALHSVAGQTVAPARVIVVLDGPDADAVLPGTPRLRTNGRDNGCTCQEAAQRQLYSQGARL